AASPARVGRPAPEAGPGLPAEPEAQLTASVRAERSARERRRPSRDGRTGAAGARAPRPSSRLLTLRDRPPGLVSGLSQDRSTLQARQRYAPRPAAAPQPGHSARPAAPPPRRPRRRTTPPWRRRRGRAAAVSLSGASRR